MIFTEQELKDACAEMIGSGRTIEAEIRECLSRKLRIDYGRVTLCSSMADLGADSLDCNELSFDIEEILGISILDEERIQGGTKVEDLIVQAFRSIKSWREQLVNPEEAMRRDLISRSISDAHEPNNIQFSAEPRD
jgi:acyl carrier protein